MEQLTDQQNNGVISTRDISENAGISLFLWVSGQRRLVHHLGRREIWILMYLGIPVHQKSKGGQYLWALQREGRCNKIGLKDGQVLRLL